MYAPFGLSPQGEGSVHSFAPNPNNGMPNPNNGTNMGNNVNVGLNRQGNPGDLPAVGSVDGMIIHGLTLAETIQLLVSNSGRQFFSQ